MAQIIADLEGHDDSHDLEGGVLAPLSLDKCFFPAKGLTTILVEVEFDYRMNGPLMVRVQT